MPLFSISNFMMFFDADLQPLRRYYFSRFLKFSHMQYFEQLTLKFVYFERIPKFVCLKWLVIRIRWSSALTKANSFLKASHLTGLSIPWDFLRKISQEYQEKSYDAWKLSIWLQQLLMIAVSFSRRCQVPSFTEFSLGSIVAFCVYFSCQLISFSVVGRTPGYFPSLFNGVKVTKRSPGTTGCWNVQSLVHLIILLEMLFFLCCWW